MAKRSDFAQKLLDDLRLRKERMAASQRSTQSNQRPIDAYAYSKQTYRGSRNVKASETISSRTGEALNRPSRSHRSANIGEGSNQIVPYGRGQSSVQMGDMSFALAFAFENGGKLRTDSSFASSIMGFLHQIKGGTMDYSKMERRSNLDRQLASTSSFPTLSPVQINEISKGAQKLNQILRACSNGLNIDRYSIEFAKELLQGAMDLEESLRMLVDLQKSSESMIPPQKKNRITLLEEEDDEDDERTIKTSEQKQLARPTFSFDKPSRHSQTLQGVGNTSLMQRTLTLAYSKERRNSNNEKQDVNTSKLLSHKRSMSNSSDNKNLNAFTEQKNQSASVQSNSEKGMIPNVIARLMGLDNLPEKLESKNTPQKESVSTQKIEGMTFKHTATGSAKKIELKNKPTENLVLPKKLKVIEPINMFATEEKKLMSGADKNSIIQKASSEVVVHNEQQQWRDLNGIKVLKGLEKATVKVDKQHNSAAQMNLIRESRRDFQVNGRKQDQPVSREQKVTVKGRANDPLLNNMLAQLEQVHERWEVDSSLQEEKESVGSNLQSEKKHTNNNNVSNQRKSQSHLGTQKHQKEKQVQHSEKQMLQARKQKGRETTSKNSSKRPHDLTNSQKKQLLINQITFIKHNSAENVDAMKLEGFPNSHYDDLIRDEASNEYNVEVKELINRKPGQITSTRNLQSEPVKGRHGIVTMMDEKSVHKLANKKVKNTRKKNNDLPEKIEEILTRRNETMFHITKQVKQQSPILPEARHRTFDNFNFSKEAERERVSMLKEADERIISSNESVAIGEPLSVRRQPHKVSEQPPALYRSDGGKVQSLQESEVSVPNNLYQGVKLVATNDMQDQATLMAIDEECKSCEIAPNTINGIHVERMDINYHSQLQNRRISEKRIQQPLTESENCLKWILATSQTFLNTAEALFRLNIPLSILQGGNQDNQDEGNKLILDCGYEVMKRKGTRQELKVHHGSKKSISSIKITSLDDLVRQLNKDMEKLKFYGRNKNSQVDVEDYLPKMLENDVCDKYPDIDCMWDLGWNEETFAFLEKYDVIRDIEKHILNGLLDEITWELPRVQNMTITH